MNLLIEAVAGFGLNLAITFVIVRFIYYPQQREKQYVVTFFAFSTIVYFVVGALVRSNIGVGVGFGMFAVFSILRYRTATIPIRDMMYLFVLLALPVLNAVLIQQQAFSQFAIANLATVGVLYVIEKEWGFAYESRKTIVYERIEMIRPENWPLLLADLQERTGLSIRRVDIGKLNFLRDTAEISIYYDAPPTTSTPQVRMMANHSPAQDDE